MAAHRSVDAMLIELSPRFGRSRGTFEVFGSARTSPQDQTPRQQHANRYCHEHYQTRHNTSAAWFIEVEAGVKICQRVPCVRQEECTESAVLAPIEIAVSRLAKEGEAKDQKGQKQKRKGACRIRVSLQLQRS